MMPDGQKTIFVLVVEINDAGAAFSFVQQTDRPRPLTHSSNRFPSLLIRDTNAISYFLDSFSLSLSGEILRCALILFLPHEFLYVALIRRDRSVSP